MELVEFLLQRIAEDEAVAREVVARASVYAAREVSWRWLRVVGDSSMWEPTNHTPARVLAECEAKRRIVAEHKTIRAAYPGTTIETDPCCATCSAGGEYPGEFPCPTMRLLALPYADHPDYRQEWAAVTTTPHDGNGADPTTTEGRR